MSTVKLPEGVTVGAGGREWRGEIPAELCPEKFKKKGANTTTEPPEKKDK